MKFIKNLFILLLALSSFNNYCAQPTPMSLEEEQKEMPSAQASSSSSQPSNEIFTFISSEGQKLQVPLSIALQSNLVKTKLDFEKAQSTIWPNLKSNLELKPGIRFNLLNILTNSLNLAAQHSNLNNKKKLYKIIQTNLLNLPFDEASLNEGLSYTIPQIVELFINSTYLEFEILQNVFADQIAQKLLNANGTLNQNSLQELINAFNNYPPDFLRDNWYLIEKFYYLRSPELRPNINNLLLNHLQQLISLLNINPGNLNYQREEIIKNWQLSVSDLVDYNKPIQSEIDNEDIELNLSKFYLKSIDGLQIIPNINNVTSIDLSKNQIATLGNNLAGLVNLKTLILNQNEISQLDNSLIGLSIDDLDLSNNRIINLGNSLISLNKLIKLNLGFNQINQLENSLHGLTALIFLYLEHNQLIDLGDELSRLINLETLYLNNNQITQLGDSLERLINLEELDLSDNQIIDLSNSLHRLINLEELYLSNNQIINLGNSFNGLINLLTLKLRNNQIVNLGNSLNELIKLEYLDLRDNHITSLDTVDLPDLLVLKIANNQIVDLTNILQLVFGLHEIDVENNPLNQASIELIEIFEAQLENGNNEDEEDEDDENEDNDVEAIEVE